MSVLNLIIILELIANAFFWWFGIFILLRNPAKRINQVIAAFFAALSTFYSSDILSSQAPSVKEYTLTFRAYAVGIYFAVAFFYHSIYLNLCPNSQRKQKILLVIAYLGAFVLPYLDAFTNLIANYSRTWTNQYFGNWIFEPGPLLNVAVGWAILLILVSCVNIVTFLRENWHDSDTRMKYILPLVAAALFTLDGISVSIHYIYPIPYFAFLFSGLAGVGSFLLSISIVFHGFIIGESLYKDRIFQYSSIAIGIIIALYIVTTNFILRPLDYQSLIFLLILTPAIITTHFVFDWLNNLTRNIIYNRQIKFSVVTDNEVVNAIRFFHRPSRLENSPLLNLKIVEAIDQRRQSP